MIDIKTIIVLLFILILEVYLVKLLRGKSTIMIASLLFVINTFLFVLLIHAFHEITETNISAPNAIDSLVSFNAYSIRTRNSIIIMGLLFLAYGLHDQYNLTNKKILLISSYLIVGLSILLLISTLIAGAFII